MKTNKLFPDFEEQVVNNDLQGEIKVSFSTNVRFRSDGTYYERPVYKEAVLDKREEDHFLVFYRRLLKDFIDYCYKSVFLSSFLNTLDDKSSIQLSEENRLVVKETINKGMLTELIR